MILGLGIDIVDVTAFEELCRSPRFVDATFTPSERRYAEEEAHGKRAQHLAVRFAAKEAALKALDGACALLDVGPPVLQLGDVEVVRDPRGRPSLAWHGRAATLASALEIQRVHVSLTHDGSAAGAVVALER